MWQFMLWTNYFVCRVPLTVEERKQRAEEAVIFVVPSRGCLVIHVDFGGHGHVKMLPSPSAA